MRLRTPPYRLQMVWGLTPGASALAPWWELTGADFHTSTLHGVKEKPGAGSSVLVGTLWDE